MWRATAALALAAALACSASNDDTVIADARDGESGSEIVDTRDTDGDTIANGHESTGDTDGDTQPDVQDTDSDGDGIPDAEEAGDTDVATPPVDSDADTVPDFRDLDADNDGLPDAEELALGTDPTRQDTDGDGALDVVEVAAGTDPVLATDSPRTRGDFVFLMPYEAPPEPPRDTLVFSTTIQMADVFFLIDRSASMEDEIVNLTNSLATTIVPAVDAVIPDVAFGVADLDICPSIRSCSSGGTAVGLRCTQLIDEDPTLTQRGLETIRDTPVCNGTHEPYLAAAWLVATDDENGPGDDWNADRVTATTCPLDGPGNGWPCFRPGAVPILVEFGDEEFLGEGLEVCTRPTYDELIAALNTAHIRFVGISSMGSVGDRDAMWTGYRDVARDTGSVDTAGNPLAFEIANNGTGIGDQVVDAIEILAGQVVMDISARAVDVVESATDTVDTTRFVERIEPNTAGGVEDPAHPGMVCVGGLPVSDADGDSYNDVFTDVLPGTIVCFDIVPRQNDSVPPATEPQLFRGQVEVLGESVTVLDTRDVYFLVPPGTYVGGPF